MESRRKRRSRRRERCRRWRRAWETLACRLTPARERPAQGIPVRWCAVPCCAAPGCEMAHGTSGAPPSPQHHPTEDSRTWDKAQKQRPNEQF